MDNYDYGYVDGLVNIRNNIQPLFKNYFTDAFTVIIN